MSQAVFHPEQTGPRAASGRVPDRPRRHPAEIPLLVIVILTTVGIMASAVFVTVRVLTGGGLLDVPQWAVVAVTVPLLLYFLRGLARAEPRVSGAKITETQFPEAHRMVVDAARHYGLEKVPDAYVVLGNGAINAFSSGHDRHRYIAVYSDLFEIGGRARNPEALRFIIGHEVGHIAAGHASFWRQLFSSLPLPFLRASILGEALSRAQEYTADNYAYSFCPEGAPTAIGLLTAGKRLLGEIDFHTMCDRAAAEGGFFTWVTNLLSTHPVNLWRAAALRDRSRPGSIFFRPKPRRPVPPPGGPPPAIPPPGAPAAQPTLTAIYPRTVPPPPGTPANHQAPSAAHPGAQPLGPKGHQAQPPTYPGAQPHGLADRQAPPPAHPGAQFYETVDRQAPPPVYPGEQARGVEDRQTPPPAHPGAQFYETVDRQTPPPAYPGAQPHEAVDRQVPPPVYPGEQARGGVDRQGSPPGHPGAQPHGGVDRQVSPRAYPVQRPGGAADRQAPPAAHPGAQPGGPGDHQARPPAFPGAQPHGPVDRQVPPRGYPGERVRGGADRQESTAFPEIAPPPQPPQR